MDTKHKPEAATEEHPVQPEPGGAGSGPGTDRRSPAVDRLPLHFLSSASLDPAQMPECGRLAANKEVRPPCANPRSSPPC